MSKRRKLNQRIFVSKELSTTFLSLNNIQYDDDNASSFASFFTNNKSKEQPKLSANEYFPLFTLLKYLKSLRKFLRNYRRKNELRKYEVVALVDFMIELNFSSREFRNLQGMIFQILRDFEKDEKALFAKRFGEKIEELFGNLDKEKRDAVLMLLNVLLIDLKISEGEVKEKIEVFVKTKFFPFLMQLLEEEVNVFEASKNGNLENHVIFNIVKFFVEILVKKEIVKEKESLKMIVQTCERFIKENDEKLSFEVLNLVVFLCMNLVRMSIENLTAYFECIKKLVKEEVFEKGEKNEEMEFFRIFETKKLGKDPNFQRITSFYSNCFGLLNTKFEDSELFEILYNDLIVRILSLMLMFSESRKDSTIIQYFKIVALGMNVMGKKSSKFTSANLDFDLLNEKLLNVILYYIDSQSNEFHHFSKRLFQDEYLKFCRKTHENRSNIEKKEIIKKVLKCLDWKKKGIYAMLSGFLKFRFVNALELLEIEDNILNLVFNNFSIRSIAIESSNLYMSILSNFNFLIKEKSATTVELNRILILPIINILSRISTFNKIENVMIYIVPKFLVVYPDGLWYLQESLKEVFLFSEREVLVNESNEYEIVFNCENEEEFLRKRKYLLYCFLFMIFYLRKENINNYSDVIEPRILNDKKNIFLFKKAVTHNSYHVRIIIWKILLKQSSCNGFEPKEMEKELICQFLLHNLKNCPTKFRHTVVLEFHSYLKHLGNSSKDLDVSFLGRIRDILFSFLVPGCPHEKLLMIMGLIDGFKYINMIIVNETNLFALLHVFLDCWDSVRNKIFNLLSNLLFRNPGKNLFANLKKFNMSVMKFANILLNSCKLREADAGGNMIHFFVKYMKVFKFVPFINNANEINFRLSRNEENIFVEEVIVDNILRKVRGYVNNEPKEIRSNSVIGSLLLLRYVLSDFRIVKSGERLKRIQSILLVVEKLVILIIHILGRRRPDLLDLNTYTIPKEKDWVAYFDKYKDEELEGEEDDSSEDDNLERILLVNCWSCVRECSLLISLQYKSVYSLEEVNRLISIYMKILLCSRHNGAIQKANVGLNEFVNRIYSKKLKISGMIEVNDVIRHWIDGLLELIKSESTTSLRRSFGLPFAFLSFLRSDSLVCKNDVIPYAMGKLISFFEGDEEKMQPKIHSRNILKYIVKDRIIGNELSIFLERIFVVSLTGLNSTNWNIRNSSLMLFVSLLQRTLMRNKSEKEIEGKKFVGFGEFFSTFPELFPFVKNLIDGDKNRLLNNESVFAILLLLSKLEFQTLEGSVDRKFELVFRILEERINCHRDYKVRELCSKILVQGKLQSIAGGREEKIIQFLKKYIQKLDAKAESLNSNQLHGLLLQIKYFVDKELTEVRFGDEKPEFDDSVIVINKYNQREVDAKILKINFKEIEDQMSEKNFLGAGSFGEVFRIDFKNRLYAVKVFHFDDEKKKNKIIRSLKKIVHFQQENVIKIYGYVEYTLPVHKIGLIMELMKFTLSKGIIEKRFTQEEKINILADIAKGMNYIHSEGYVNLDLKCSNVMISENGIAKIADLDSLVNFSEFVKYKSKSSGEDDMIGTSIYISPDLLNGKINKKSDIYSYSIMIISLIFDRYNPYENRRCSCGMHVGDMVEMHSSILPMHIIDHKLRPVIPDISSNNEWIVDLIKSCWNLKPSKRKTFSQIINVLEKREFKEIENGEEYELLQQLIETLVVKAKILSSNPVVTDLYFKIVMGVLDSQPRFKIGKKNFEITKDFIIRTLQDGNLLVGRQNLQKTCTQLFLRLGIYKKTSNIKIFLGEFGRNNPWILIEIFNYFKKKRKILFGNVDSNNEFLKKLIKDAFYFRDEVLVAILDYLIILCEKGVLRINNSRDLNFDLVMKIYDHSGDNLDLKGRSIQLLGVMIRRRFFINFRKKEDEIVGNKNLRSWIEILNRYKNETNFLELRYGVLRSLEFSHFYEQFSLMKKKDVFDCYCVVLTLLEDPDEEIRNLTTFFLSDKLLKEVTEYMIIENLFSQLLEKFDKFFIHYVFFEVLLKFGDTDFSNIGEVVEDDKIFVMDDINLFKDCYHKSNFIRELLIEYFKVKKSIDQKIYNTFAEKMKEFMNKIENYRSLFVLKVGNPFYNPTLFEISFNLMTCSDVMCMIYKDNERRSSELKKFSLVFEEIKGYLNPTIFKYM